MKTLLKAAVVIVCAFATIAPAIASADTVSDSEAMMSRLPQLYITEISLPKTEFSAGEAVEGEFKLLNAGTVDEPSAYYRIYLSQYDKTSPFPVAYLDSLSFGPIYAKAGEELAVPFSYVIPRSANGDNLGIRIRAFTKTGAPLGWEDKPVKVTGGAGMLSVTSAYLEVGGKKFQLQNGPTVKAGETPVLNLSVKGGPEKVALTPSFKIYDRAAIGQPLMTKDDSAQKIEIVAGKTVATKVTLPLPEKPGVYVALVEFLDDSGISRLPVMEVRYIKEGQILTIQSVSSDQTILEAGEKANITLVFTGTPADIASGNPEAKKYGEARLEMSVINEQGKAVGLVSGDYEFGSYGALKIPVEAETGAKALAVSLSVTKDGKTLATYSAPLSPNFETLRGEYLEYVLLVRSVIMVISIIIVIIVAFMIRRNKAVPAAIAAFAIFAAGTIYGSGMFATEKAAAFDYIYLRDPEYTLVRGGNYPHLEIIITKPLPNHPFKKGGSFYVIGSVIDLVCNNTAYRDTKVTVWRDGVTPKTAIITATNLGDAFKIDSDLSHVAWLNEAAFSIGPFVVTENEGIYGKFYVKAEDRWNDPTGKFSIWEMRTGEEKILSARTPIASLSFSPATVASGASSIMTWSAGYAENPTATCQLYDPTKSAWENVSCSGSRTISSITSARTYKFRARKYVTWQINSSGGGSMVYLTGESPATVNVSNNTTGGDGTGTSGDGTTGTEGDGGGGVNGGGSSCTGNKPDSGIACTGQGTAGNWKAVASCTEVGGSCEYVCDWSKGYEFDSASNSCKYEGIGGPGSSGITISCFANYSERRKGLPVTWTAEVKNRPYNNVPGLVNNGNIVWQTDGLPSGSYVFGDNTLKVAYSAAGSYGMSLLIVNKNESVQCTVPAGGLEVRVYDPSTTEN